MKTRRWVLAVAGLVLCCLPLVLSGEPKDTPKPTAPAVSAETIHSLSEFGPTGTLPEIQAAYAAAIRTLRGKGGMLLVPASAWKQLRDLPLQGLDRTPAPPAETTRWREGPGATVVVVEEQRPVLHVPPLSGLRVERQLRLEEGDSAPHWGTHPLLTLDNHVVYGSVSYLDWLQAPVSKGNDRRFYLATVRGLHPGQFLNIHGGPGYGGGVTRACVKSLGYDAEKQMPYLVADTHIDHVAGAILHNKSNTGILHMVQDSHADNQTYDVKVIRNQYAHGDTYVYYCDFNYMSNVHSAAGDENGNCYAAFIRSLDNNFRGEVEAVDWKEARLKFKPPAQHVETLGDSRPLINRNPKKAITAGKVWIVPAECCHETVDTGKCPFGGKTYPSRLVTNPITGVVELKMGGLIRGDKDCPWTPAVVGRFFAVTTTEERTPKGNLRWYLITSFHANEDGTKDIEIQRFWWGAKSAGSPTLYRRESYSWDGHLRPLEYAIAPGTYVNDVARALPGGDRGGQRLLGVAPYRDQGTELDFAAGDAIEQAIGPDPFRPQAMRVWMWEDVPGAFPSAVFDLANYGAASRHSAVTVRSHATSLEQAAKSPQQKPAWDNVIVIESAAGVGINCKGDFADAAILFQQPHREQAIKWHHGHDEKRGPQEATLTVPKATGELTFQGKGVRTNGPVSGVAGLSGEQTPARNLRGKNVAVEEKAKGIRIHFARPEADGEYAVFIEQSWLTERAISDKGPEGFTVKFGTQAPAGAKLDWMIVR
jgi:hypothetical protein